MSRHGRDIIPLKVCLREIEGVWIVRLMVYPCITEYEPSTGRYSDLFTRAGHYIDCLHRHSFMADIRLVVILSRRDKATLTKGYPIGI